MATYAIGDVQGCYRQLEALVEKIQFNPGTDRLWFVGDLVNRGPDSLAVLKFVKSLGSSAVTVLGNHDIHLLAVSAGVMPHRAKDTFHDVLHAPDADELIEWVRSRPLLYSEDRYTLVHAGLLPQWTIAEAVHYADALGELLRGDECREFLRLVYDGTVIEQWSEQLPAMDKLKVVLAAFTRLRVCSADGRMNLGFSRTRADIPPGYMPWFDVPGRKSADSTIIFGHWAALGLYVQHNSIGLDSGCVWGRALTALRLEDRRIFQIGCEQASQRAIRVT